jgi:hypothetical protein
MSDNTFLPGDSAQAAPDNRRNVILLGGLGAVVLAGAGYYFLAGSSSDSTVASSPLPPRHVTSAPVKSAKPVAKPAAKLAVIPATSTAQIGRNPFKALYVQPAVAPAGAATSSQASSGPSTSTASTTSGTAASPTVAPYKMTLVSVTGGANNTARE